MTDPPRLLRSFDRVQVYSGDHPFEVGLPSAALTLKEARKLRRELNDALQWYDSEVLAREYFDEDKKEGER